MANWPKSVNFAMTEFAQNLIDKDGPKLANIDQTMAEFDTGMANIAKVNSGVSGR